MPESATVVLARLGRPHGIRGEVSVEVRTDAPDSRLAVGESFATDPDIGPLTVARARWHKDRLLLTFEEVADRNRAEEIRNTLLVGAPDDLGDDAWYLDDLVGLEVRVEGEARGTVTGIVEGTAQDLLEVEIGDRRVLVPFVGEIVPEVDVEAGFVVLTPPGGLLD